MQKSKLQFKIQNFLIYVVIFISGFYILNLYGCISSASLKKAWYYTKQSEAHYEAAIAEYKNLIAKGKDLDRLHFELGQLYFTHGEFLNAWEELKNSNYSPSKKLLSITHFQLGNFRDALEIFNKEELPDDESLYYHGLTSERLNLFDQALETYRKIKNNNFKSLALERINIIEKHASLRHIKDVSAQVNEILLNAPQSEKYPQAGALILFCDEKIEVTSDGKRITSMHYVIKILNERGKEDFSETHIDYDSTYDKVELEYARTIKPDGLVVEVGSRHLRDVSKYLNFPLYSNARVYIISFPEITEGAIIEYKLKIYRNQLLNKKDFVLGYPLQASEPIIQANFTLKLPKDNPARIKFLNENYNNFGADLNPDIKEKDNYLIYNWQFKDIPQIIPEANMPAEVRINPAIIISTFDSWQEIYSWWWELAKTKMEPDAAIREKVQQLIASKNSEEEKIRAIYNFCSQKIRYVAIEYGQAGYEPHYASDIFKNKYGDCKDQSILLVTMLKEAGILCWPVLIATRNYYNLNEDFPAVLFNHCITLVPVKDKIIFLDPTAQTCPFGDLPSDDQERKVLVVSEKGYQIQQTPLYPAEHNLAKQFLKIKVNKDESISAEKSILTFGVYDQAQRFWLLYTPPELIAEALKEKIQEVSIGATLDKYDIKNLNNLDEPIVLNYNFYGPEYFTSAGNLRIMPQLTGLDVSLVAKDKRKYAIDFGILDSKEIIFEIEIPEDFAIKYMPGNVKQECPWLEFTAEYNKKGNKIYFSQNIRLNKNHILESDYSDFKKFFEQIAKRIKQRIVLEKIR